MRSENSTRRGMGLGALCVALVLFALACSGGRGEPSLPSPAPDFNHISEAQLESAMWQLADGIVDLQALFSSRQPIRQSQRQEVIDILERMIAATDALGPEGVASNHRRITHNLGRFREKLVIARDSAARNPPRYYLVGNLAGTCLACHQRW